MRHRWVVVLTLVLAAPALAQTSSRNERLGFEVASVKRSTADDSKSIPSVLLFLPGGGFRRTNVTLKSLIQTAYGVQDFQVSGAMGWMESEIYDIEARSATGANPSRAEV